MSKHNCLKFRIQNIKHWVIATLMICSLITKAQNKLPFTTTQPFNKGNFKIDLSYSSLMQRSMLNRYPDFRVAAGYGFSDWCVAGIFGSFGIYNYHVSVSDIQSYQMIYEGNISDHYLHYGIQAELHPMSAFLPNFYWIDPYCRVELGMRSVIGHHDPEYNDNSIFEPNSNDFLYGGSVGLAINPSRYFGVFYELAFDNLNKELNLNKDETKTKPIHRFGLNVRFGGPKK